MTHPIIPWPGGKRRLLPHLLPLIGGRPHTCYVEPFAGVARREVIYRTWQ